MAKQWSMDEIDNLLETTQENGVSDLVAELMGEPAAVEQADPVDEAALPVLDEEDDFDDDYDYDYDDFDEDEGPDVEGVDDLFGNPVEEALPAEPEPVEGPAAEPEEEVPVDEAPEEETPAAKAPSEARASVFEPTPAPAAATVVNYAAQAKAAQSNLTDETDYVPGFVDDDVVIDDEVDVEGGKGGFMNKLRAFRESFIHVVENAGEEEEEFTDEDYGLAPAPRDDGVERMTGRGKFMDRELASQKTKVFDPLAESAPSTPRQVEDVHNKGALFKGIDENAESPKMIMELADDKPQMPEEKKALAQKTVGIRPIRNANIEHQILTTRIEKTTAEFTKLEDEEMPSSDNKVSAAPKGTTTVASASAAVAAAAAAAVRAVRGEEEPVPEPDPAEPQVVTEGVAAVPTVDKTRKFTNTADLEPIPTIIAADAELNTFDKTIVAKGDNKTIEHEDNEGIDGQIKLFGFDDENPEVQPVQVDEDATEEQLRERRAAQVKGFKLNHREDDEPDVPQREEEPLDYDPNTVNEDLRFALGDERFVEHDTYVGDYLNDEYESAELDAERIEYALESKVRFTFITSIIQAVLVVVGLVLSGILASNGYNLETFAGSAGVTVGVAMGILALAAALSYKTIVKGVLGIARLRLNASSAVTVVVLANLIADLIYLLASQSTGVTVALFTAAATFTVLLSNVARHLSFRRALDNLRLLTSGIHMYSTEVIPNERDAAEVTRGMQLENPVVAYNTPIADQPRFVEDSFADDPADQNAHLPTLAALGVALLAALIFGLVRHSAVFGVSVFAAIVTIAVPAFALLASNLSLYIDDKRFSRKGSAILGHRAVEQSAYVNTFAIDSKDIFTKDSCHIIGIKTFHDMRIDDAILYAAALVIGSEGPLADEFQNVILGKYDLLPSVDGLAYEERLGLSAWIGERRVLFGNRNLLLNHNVELPDEEFEKQYTVNGRKVNYLAISGKVAAMFVVKYRPVKQYRRYLQNIDRAGITILVRNTDCNITEEMVAKYYHLPVTAVKVLGPVQGDIAGKYFEAEKPYSTSGLLHNGSIESSLKTLYEARRLYDGVSINNILAMAFAVIAGIVGIALAILGVEAMSDAKLLIFQAVFTFFGAGLPALRSRTVGK
ncbi:MAG: hypothetical protein IJI32_03840 [Clostridia bacterium]|nr:hypothetical protein [Clostridia bacterium]